MPGAEVVVVGAGPAGSAVALLLARRGRDVLLVDQARFPRDKPCGEYLNPAAVAVLRRLGLEAELRAAGARTVAGVVLTSANGCEVRVPFPPRDGACVGGLSLPRMALDAALLDAARAAGAQAREGFRVDDLLRSGDRTIGVVGHAENGVESLRASLVLAADGTRSVIARRLGLARAAPALRRFGLVAHFEGVRGDDWVEMHAGRRGYCGLGYWGEQGATVAIVAEAEDLPRLRGRPEAFFGERLAEFSAVTRRLGSARPVGRVQVTGSMAAQVGGASAPGVLLLGDAAGFYDPYTGEGISYALRGAELAAAAVEAALGGGEGAGRNPEGTKKTKNRGVCLEEAAFGQYAARRRAEFAPRVLVSRVIQAVLRRPWLLEAVFCRFQADPSLARRLIGVTAGVLPPRAILTPAYLARLLAGVQVFRCSGVQAGKVKDEHEHGPIPNA